MVAWRSSGFRDALRAWVEEVAGPVVAMQQAKLRPWATVWRIRTERRMFYAKQNCAGQSFEAALLALLAQLAPSYVVPVTAVDTERGLLLTPDQGQVFGESVATDDLASWCRLVTRAMELARLVMPHSEAMLASGLTPSRVPADVTDHVRPCFDTVAALGLPDTLVHKDLHTHNAFDRPDGLILFDFADAVLGHPLSGLMVPLDVLAEQLGHPGPHDPRLQRVADAALEVWSDLAPMRELRAALPAALRLGRLDRAESWARVVPDLTGQDADDFGGAAAAWLARVPEPVPVRFD